jgi:hypothetical protein
MAAKNAMEVRICALSQNLQRAADPNRLVVTLAAL